MRKHRNEPLSEADRARIRLLIEELGERRAAEIFDVEPRTLVRILAGLGTHAGTRALVRERLRDGIKAA